MNIAFDAVALLGPMSKNRGIGNYAQSLLKTLLRVDTKNHYFFFNAVEKTDIFRDEVQVGILQEYDFPMLANRECLFSAGFLDIYRSVLERFLKENEIDVFYITSPFDGHFPPYQETWFSDVHVVACVYDIIPYVMRAHYLPNPGDIDWYMERVEMLRWADRYSVISQSVKDDMVSYLNFPAEKIDVIWGAPHDRFQKIDVPQTVRRELGRKFGFDSPFIMCTGGDDERKNLGGLIRAFGKLPKELTAKYQLAIVCKLSEPSVKRYQAIAKELGVTNRVILTNFVSDEELLNLYNLAYLVAFPSTYEGFGLPVVEAWACGVPVLTSNNSSLAQIAGDAAILVDPFSEEDIRRGLEYALTEADLSMLAEKGRARLQHFRWDKVAQLTVDCFESAGSLSVKSEHAATRKRLAFFTPLPPVQSGISDYSVDILSSLSDRFDIDVYIDDGYTADCQLPDTVRVFPHTSYEAHRAAYFDTIFQMGNSEYHVYMWDYLRRFGGTLVLHDYNMHNVFQAVALTKKNDIALYSEMVAQEIGAESAGPYIQDVSRGAALKIQELELNAYLTDYVDRTIVHSAESKRKLLIHDSHRNVAWIRLYARIDEFPNVEEARQALDLSQDALVIAAFGHIHETKRAIPLIQAFAKLAEKYSRVQLLFVGKLDDSLRTPFLAMVKKFGLERRILVTGYTDIARFQQYIDAADICVNLRWPYNGETSGSLMRILAKGKCVLVNDIGSFSEIPDEACVKIPSVEKMTEREEVTAIYSALKRLAEDETERVRLQQAARRFAEVELDLKKISRQYENFILDSRRTCVTENLLEKLREEVKTKHMTDADIHALAKILAYA